MSEEKSTSTDKAEVTAQETVAEKKPIEKAENKMQYMSDAYTPDDDGNRPFQVKLGNGVFVTVKAKNAAEASKLASENKSKLIKEATKPKKASK